MKVYIVRDKDLNILYVFENRRKAQLFVRVKRLTGHTMLTITECEVK